MAQEKQQIGRLALRAEGDFWNAYYAMPDTMDGALLLGSLHMRLVEVPARKAEFMDLMRSCVGDLIELKMGHRPTWKEPRVAPDHERQQ